MDGLSGFDSSSSFLGSFPGLSFGVFFGLSLDSSFFGCSFSLLFLFVVALFVSLLFLPLVVSFLEDEGLLLLELFLSELLLVCLDVFCFVSGLSVSAPSSDTFSFPLSPPVAFNSSLPVVVELSASL